MDVLCIGSSVVDISAQPVGPSDTWKEKQKISEIKIMVGGDASNQSIRLADIGLSVGLLTCVGADQNGVFLKASLEERGVDTSNMSSKSGLSTGTALVLVSADGERHVFSTLGAHSLLSKADCPYSLLDGISAITIAGLFSLPEFERDGLLEYLKEAKRRGILVFSDLATDKLGLGLPGIKRFLPYLDYFLPSLYDAMDMTGGKDAQECAEIYRSLGVANVIIKCGEDGCYYLSEDISGWAPAVKVSPVDTTGAGDCMCALFISRILKGDDIDRACRYACAGASYSTLFAGASSEKITPDILDKWIKEQTL